MGAFTNTDFSKLLHKKRILILTLWRSKKEQGTVQLIQGSPQKPCGKEALVPWSLIRSLTPLHGSIGNKLARTTLHSENYLFSPRAQASSLIFPTNKGVLPLQLHHTFTSGEAISISRQHDSKYLNT